MKFRLQGFDLTMTATQREAAMMDQMIEAVNLSANLEERLIGLMSIQHFLTIDWDVIESNALDSFEKRFTDKKGKLAQAIQNHHSLFELKREVDSVCDILKRTIDRLTSMQWVARSASGSSPGMM
jgi:hypothetical protein